MKTPTGIYYLIFIFWRTFNSFPLGKCSFKQVLSKEIFVGNDSMHSLAHWNKFHTQNNPFRQVVVIVVNWYTSNGILTRIGDNFYYCRLKKPSEMCQFTTITITSLNESQCEITSSGRTHPINQEWIFLHRPIREARTSRHQGYPIKDPPHKLTIPSLRNVRGVSRGPLIGPP